MQLRDYQVTLSDQGVEILKKYWLVYLALEVRVWKTFISLETAKKYWAKKVLFITKLKAISSIQKDYEFYKNDFDLTIINYESLSKIKENDFDIIICDEAHNLWTFPKPNLKVRSIKKRFLKIPMILLSWTPTPEWFCQFFHQFFVSFYNPWKNFVNFYKWHRSWYWDLQEKQISKDEKRNDWSIWNYDKIMQDIWHLILTYTQQEAWFTTDVKEEVLFVEMEQKTYDIIAKLKEKKVIQTPTKVLLADTKVKEMSKIHQLYSWTVKFEDKTSMILDYSKWIFIKKYFEWKKIWIFYKFQEEKELLKNVFWENITDNLEEFNNSWKNIMLQIISGREWISLKEADFLVFYNIDFSALSYLQAKDRMTTINRQFNKIYWIFSKWWLESQIYKTVQNKKNFTSKIYEKC